MPRSARLALAKRHAARATELDGSLVEAHGTEGLADMLLYRFDEAETRFLTGLALDPRDGQVREWLVHLYVWMGRFDEALEQAEQAVEIDPLSPSARGELARALLVNGRCDEALAELARLADLDPPLLRAGAIAAQCHAQRGMWDAAVAAVSVGLPTSGVHGQAEHAHFLGRAGREEEARAVLEQLVDRARRTGENAFWVAVVYAGLGQLDEAFEWLERAVDDHSLIFEVMEPGFQDLHADPRFEVLLQRIARR